MPTNEAQPTTPDTVTDRLRAIPVRYATPDPATLSKLPRATGPREDRRKGSCAECGGWHDHPAIHIDYQGHADVTLALIDVDPAWSWRPVAFDADGAPLVRPLDSRLVMWGYLSVLGVERLCVGTCDDNKGDPEKELIGDLLRNGAMRFGIATKLWSKVDRADPAGSDEAGGYEGRPRGAQNARRAPRARSGSSRDGRGADARREPAEPTFRTQQEARIVAAVNAMDAADRDRCRQEFRAQFGSPLVDLAPERHQEAAEWLSTWMDEATAEATQTAVES